MRDEVRAEIRWLHRQKGFSVRGIAKHTGLPQDVIEAEIAALDRPSPKRWTGRKRAKSEAQ